MEPLRYDGPSSPDELPPEENVNRPLAVAVVLAATLAAAGPAAAANKDIERLALFGGGT